MPSKFYKKFLLLSLVTLCFSGCTKVIAKNPIVFNNISSEKSQPIKEIPKVDSENLEPVVKPSIPIVEPIVSDDLSIIELEKRVKNSYPVSTGTKKYFVKKSEQSKVITKPIKITLRSKDDLSAQSVSVIPGQAIISVSPKMRVGEKAEIIVRVLGSELNPPIEDLLYTKIRPLVLGKHMTCKLIAGNFEINSAPIENQIYDPALKYTEWRWIVTPIKEADKYPIELKFSVRVETPNMATDYIEIPVMIAEATIEPNSWWKIKRFITVNYLPILVGTLGTILTFIFTILIKYMRKKKIL